MLPLSLMEMNYGAPTVRTAHRDGERQGNSATHQALGAAEDMRELEAGVAHRRRVDERGYFLTEQKHNDVSSRLPHAKPRDPGPAKGTTGSACHIVRTAMFAKHMR